VKDLYLLLDSIIVRSAKCFDCWSPPFRMMRNHELGEDILNVFWVNVVGYTVRAEIR
jgi:hypothetical protein